MRLTLLLSLLSLVLMSCAPRASRATAPNNSQAAPLVAPRAVPAEFAAMVASVNSVRAKGYDCGVGGRFGAAPPLAWNPALAQAAGDHNRDMLANNLFSHNGSDGSEPSARVERRGYTWQLVGENLAYATPGHFTQTSVVEAWLESPGHCAILMNADFREIGAAKLTGTFEFWTQVFATRQ